MKVKIFKGTVSGNIESTINQWIFENKLLPHQIISLAQSTYEKGHVIITILYSEID